ncbi:MAG: glycoside hydrolase family 3 N-terminal domain-containing protein, partial [Terriglobales bacterium]
STAYPAGIAMAATWDADLERQVGESIGREARGRGVHIMLGPGVNIYRAPMAGRDFEYFGEDPFLASRMAVAWIDGVQSQGVMATVKHFVANNQEYDRHNASSDIDERTLREIYLPAFEAAVREAHVGAIMDSYNPINGMHATQNAHTNIEIAKKDWGFPGLIMSDWDATYDGVAAANGGLDLEMPSGKFMNRATLLPAVRDGRVSQATIDDKVRRILREEIRFGFLDREQQDLSIPNWNQQARAIALRGAQESMVLLKNEGPLLPLQASRIRSIAVIGPDAHPAVTQGGGSAHVNPITSVSFLQGIGNHVGSATKVFYSPGEPDLRTAVDQSQFSTAGIPGLKGEYFNNANLEGAPALTRTDRRIDFHWPNGYASNAPQDFSVRWTGTFHAANAGDYRAWLEGEHLFRLYVDDKLVVDRWSGGETTHQSFIVAPLTLSAGDHSIRLEEHSTPRGWLSSADKPSIAFAFLPVADVVPADAVKMAAGADVAIVCIGFDRYSESEGFDRTFALPGFQDDLIRAIVAVNKNTVVVLTAGGDVDMTRWLDRVPALVHAWYPGQE